MIRTLPLLTLLLALASTALKAEDLQTAVSPTEITADHFESISTDKEMTTLLEGNVVLTGTNIRVTCDRLVTVSVRFGAKDQVVAKENQFKSLIASGRVKIVQGERIATCGRAEVLPGDNKIILTDKPMVEDRQHQVTWMGEDLYLLRGERRVHGNHVRIVGPSIKDLGFDKNEKPATEAPAPTATP